MKIDDIEIRRRTLQLIEPGASSVIHVCGGVLLNRHRNENLCLLTVSWPAISHMEILCDTGKETVINSQTGTDDSKWSFNIPVAKGCPFVSLSPHFIRWENGNVKVQNRAVWAFSPPLVSCIPSLPRFLEDIPNGETFSVATITPVSCFTNQEANKNIGTPFCLCEKLCILRLPPESHIVEFKIDPKAELPSNVTDTQITGCPILDHDGNTVALAYYANWKDGKVSALNLKRYRTHMEAQPCWR